jgi:type IV secretory pathway VirB4 component
MVLRRGVPRGRRAVIVDPKSEYGALATALGGTVVALGDGAWCNPFRGALGETSAFAAQLLATVRERSLSDEERATLDDAWTDEVRKAPRPLVRLREMLARDESPAATTLSATLRRLIVGDLRGIVDGTSEPVELRGNCLVLDLSAWWLTDAVRTVALVAWAAAEALLSATDTPGYLVIDEAWALLESEFATQWLRGSWKLARAKGVAHVLVLHRASDVEAAGEYGSAQRARATGLLRDCETSFLFRQPLGEMASLADDLGASAREKAYLVAIPKGVVVARYGAARSVVRLLPNEEDVEVIDTDAAMR